MKTQNPPLQNHSNHQKVSPSLNGSPERENKTFTVLSMFAGCGGLDLGFLGGFQFRGIRHKKLPFQIVGAYDNDPKAIETYKRNVGMHGAVRDLSNGNPAELPHANVLVGGFPCQDFSSCGPKRGLESERGRLYLAMVRYMKVHRPVVVVAENVVHLASMESGRVLKTIIRDFESPGYRFTVWRLFAPDYGIPQRRTRLFIVGVREDLIGSPTPPLQTHKNRHRAIEWAIDDLKGVDDCAIENQEQYFLASKAKRGNGQGDEVSREGEPAYTVRANAKSRVQFHYSLPRRLTVRECARIQTFPDSFIFTHSATANIIQIGNAVPPMLAHRVASSIAGYLLDQPAHS